MKVLVTGAQGFVGRAIVERLRETNFEVIELVRHATPYKPTIEKDAKEKNIKEKDAKEKDVKEKKAKVTELYAADITNKNEVSNLKKLGEIDVIIHCAGLAHQFKAEEESLFYKVNVEGTENILELGEYLRIKHFILISSVSVYGNKSGNKNGNENGNEKTDERIANINEDTKCRPGDAYAESKLKSEIKARVYCERAKINLTILRLTTVIGEGDPGNTLRLIKAIERRFIWIGKGKNRKSLIHRDDVADACVVLIREKKAGTEIFNVSAEPLKMKEIVETIGKELNRKISKFSINPNIFSPLFRLNERFLKVKKIEKLRRTIEKWLSEDAYAFDKLKKEYNFEAKINPRQALVREVRWYLDNK